jgi:excisionase family DNA binding protein
MVLTQNRLGRSNTQIGRVVRFGDSAISRVVLPAARNWRSTCSQVRPAPGRARVRQRHQGSRHPLHEIRIGAGTFTFDVVMDPRELQLGNESLETPVIVKTAAKFLGVSASLVYAYVERRQIPHYRMMGRAIRFRLSELAQ